MTKEKKDLEEIVLPEPGTPDGEAFGKRLEEFGGNFLAWMNERLNKTEGGFFGQLAFSQLIAGGSYTLRRIIEEKVDPGVSWASPWTDFFIDIKWDWVEKQIRLLPEIEELPNEILEAILNGEDPFKTKIWGEWSALHLGDALSHTIYKQLTNNIITILDQDGEEFVHFPNKEDQEKAASLPEVPDRALFIESKRVPHCVGGQIETDNHGRQFLRVFLNNAEDPAQTSPALVLSGDIEGEEVKFALSILLWPLVLNMKEGKAYFPAQSGLIIIPKTEASSVAAYTLSPPIEVYFSPDDKEKGTAPININPEERGWTQDPKWADSVWEFLTVDGPAYLLKTAIPKEKDAVQEVRTATMSTFPTPRAAAQRIKKQSSRRSLSNLFKNSSGIPDYSFDKDKSLREALDLFWACIEDHLDEVARGKWERKPQADGTTIISLYGLQVKETKELWDNAVQSMKAEQKGPGLRVVPPEFIIRNRMEKKEVLVQTDLLLWPKASPEKGGEAVPPVSFFSTASPGYVALLDRQGTLPFFADGWVWYTVGAAREGYRMDGSARLLYPEGRAALKRAEERRKDILEKALMETKQNPALPFDDIKAKEEETIRDLEEGIRAQEAYIERLSLYDTAELSYCIFKTWNEQKKNWFRGEVELDNGVIVSTYPAHIIRLDPDALRLILDPNEKTGKNWRNKLRLRLEALSLFERTTRDRKGKTIESGDRFLKLVIDGLSMIDENSGGDHLIIHKALQAAGGIPSRYFFVEVSLQFMANYYYIHEPEKGKLLLNYESVQYALEKAKDKSLPKSVQKEAKKKAEEHKQKAREKPTFEKSSKLISVSNLEDWTQDKKDFAFALEEEKTNKRTNKRAAKVRREGVSFVPCSGSWGKGYTVKGWMDKAFPEKIKTGPRGGMVAYKALLGGLRFFMEHDYIKLQIKLSYPKGNGKNKTAETYWNEETLAILEEYRQSPQSVYAFKLTPYLPEDLEKRLRGRLKIDGIEALDEGEDVVTILAPRTPGGLRPIDVRMARGKAGWTQSELAEKVGVSKMSISQWEKGENGGKPIPPKREMVLREILGPYLKKEGEAPEK